MTRRYDPSEIEPKWQRVWEDEGLYRASEDPRRSPAALLRARHVPVPLGRPAHGARRGVQRRRRGRPVSDDARLQRAASDRVGRVRPAGRERRDQARRSDPTAWTYANIEQQAASFRRMGMSFDWTRRLTTCDPEYYRWTQWLFLRLFETGLAYRKNAPVNWCPKDQTVLANEQVIKGACERCGTPVERRDLTQWFFKITDYAQRLLDDMDDLVEWPERVLTMQRNWIGRSRGRARHVHDRRDRRGGRGLHDAPRHAVGRHVLRVRGRASAGPKLAEAGRHAGAEVEPLLEQVARRPSLTQPRGGRHEGRRLPGRARREPGERRAGPCLRRAVRADGVRHRRDHGGAGPRPARLRVRARSTACRSASVIQPEGEPLDADDDDRGVSGTRA